MRSAYSVDTGVVDPAVRVGHASGSISTHAVHIPPATTYDLQSGAGLVSGGPLPWGTPWWSNLSSWPSSSQSWNLSNTCNPGCGVTFQVPNGSYLLTVPCAISVTYAVRLALPQCFGGRESIGADVSGSGNLYLWGFAVEDFVSVTSRPPELPFATSPPSGWVTNDSNITLYVQSPAGWQFVGWNGTGNGSYSGSLPEVVLHVGAPINETAVFESVYEVAFSQSGLPLGTAWGVNLSGSYLRAASGFAWTSLPNGTYRYGAPSPLTTDFGTRFTSWDTNGTVTVAGYSVTVGISYTEEFRVSFTVSPPRAGSVNFSGGWVDANTAVTATVTTEPWWTFGYWNGTGPASRAGRTNPLTVQVDSPLNETANLLPVYHVSFLADPANCGPVLLNGSAVPDTGTVNLTGGPYHVTVPYC